LRGSAGCGHGALQANGRSCTTKRKDIIIKHSSRSDDLIDLGSVTFVIDVSPLPRPDLEAYSNDLFDQWALRTATNLDLEDYALSLDVEEGSLKGRAKILAKVGVVMATLANYEGFFAGVKRIESQVQAVSDFVSERAVAPFNSGNRRVVVRKRRGVLGQVQDLFVRVQRREMTAEQATRVVEEILGSEAESSPEFMKSLKDSLGEVRLHPEQLMLPIEILEMPRAMLLEPAEGGAPKKRPFEPRPKPVAPSPERFKVEIWRESKKGKKLITVTAF
jgi:hypothetical protein